MALRVGVATERKHFKLTRKRTFKPCEPRVTGERDLLYTRKDVMSNAPCPKTANLVLQERVFTVEGSPFSRPSTVRSAIVLVC